MTNLAQRTATKTMVVEDAERDGGRQTATCGLVVVQEEEEEKYGKEDVECRGGAREKRIQSQGYA